MSNPRRLGKIGPVLNLSPEKVLLLLLIALLVLGPNRLPEAARGLGRLVANVRKMSGTFQTEMRDALAEPSDALKGAVGDLGLDSLRDSLRDVGQVTNAFRNPLGAVTRSLTDAVTGPATPAPPTVGPATAGPTPPGPATLGDVPAPPDDPSLN